MESLKSKLALLFILHPISITAHNINEMLPLFFEGTIVIPDGGGVTTDFVQWATVTQYMVPAIAVLLMVASSHVFVRIIALVCAVLTVLPNSMHFLEHVLGEASSANRWALLVVEINAIMMTLFAIKWLREPQNKPEIT